VQPSGRRRPKRSPAEKGAAIDEIVARFKKLPVLDPRPADEIVAVL
jgi:hypothetical protein